ncbi:PKD domain-containing protein [Candidatus Woesearchaeota archaeon]|nr:PKD domain-containing protein [Candidatus Woesearchaeota archaeon]
MCRKKKGLLGLRASRKGDIGLSVRLVVLIIIGLVTLVLAAAFIRYSFGQSGLKFRQQLLGYAKPPVPIISSPNKGDVFTVFQKVTFDASKSYDQNYNIVGYFWDFDGNSIIDSHEAVVNDSYWEPGEYNLTLKVVNEEGAIGTASQIVRVYTKNEKDMASLEDSLFLVRDNKRANSETILRLIPLIVWNDATGFHRIPYYVYYMDDEGTNIKDSDLKEIMDSYEKTKAYIFDDDLMFDNTPGSDPHKRSTTKTIGGKNYDLNIYSTDGFDEAYFDFWDLYEYVVLVDPSETGSKLIASLFAAFYNSPIMFVNEGNLEAYKDYINNSGEKGPTQRVYYVPSIYSIGPEVDDFVSKPPLEGGIGVDRQYYSETELRNAAGVNRIIKLTSNVTIRES